MKTYYCVTEAYFDDGRVTAAISCQLEAEDAPENTFSSHRDRDIYCTWFDNVADASQRVDECRGISSRKYAAKA